MLLAGDPWKVALSSNSSANVDLEFSVVRNEFV